MTVIPLRRRRRLPATPAFGTCPPAGLRRRVVVLAVLVVLLTAALGVRASGVLRSGQTDESLSPTLAVTGVAPGLLRGGQPVDVELLRLRDDYGVRAVIDVNRMDVEEQAETRDLGLRTLELDLGDGQAPTAPDMLRLVRFLRSTVAPRPGSGGTGVVYLHDADGRGSVLVLSAMLQVLRGVPLATVLDGLRAGGAPALSDAQSAALSDMERVRIGAAPTGAYAVLRGESW